MTSFKLEQDIPAAHICDPAHAHDCFYLGLVLDPATPETELQDAASLLLTRMKNGICKRGPGKIDSIMDEALLSDKGSKRQEVLGGLFVALAKEIGTPRRTLDTLYRAASFCEPNSYLDCLLTEAYLTEVQKLPEDARWQELSLTARHAHRDSALHSESTRMMGQQRPCFPACQLAR